METIFYLIGAYYVAQNIISLFNLKSRCNETMEFSLLAKMNKGDRSLTESIRHSELLKKKAPYILVGFLWCTIGLFTWQTQWFGIYFLYGFGIILPISNAFKTSYINGNKIPYHLLYIFSCLTGVLFGTFVILNNYIYRIDFMSLFG